MIRSKSGRALSELSMDKLRTGELGPEDFHISAETLNSQADAAQAAGYSQLADNLRRAAEMTDLSNQEVLNIYNALRPRRSSYEELLALAGHLEDDLHMPRTAAFIREAAEAYRLRGILKDA